MNTVKLELKKKKVERMNSELHAGSTCIHMTSKPLNVLKRGLASLKRHISAKKDHLTTCLKNKQPISKEDEVLQLGSGPVQTVYLPVMTTV